MYISCTELSDQINRFNLDFMLKKILPILLLWVIQSSCTPDAPAPTPTGSGGTTISDPARYILISGKELNPATSKDMFTLSCYNPDMTLRWKKTELGNTNSGNHLALNTPFGVIYANNVVYFAADSVFSIGTNYFTYNLFFAFDVNTGNLLWKRRSTTDHIQHPIIRNDTIYCNNMNNSNVNYIAAYNPVNGSEYWKKQIAEKWGGDHLTLDGTMLYYISIQSNLNTLVNAFDLSTRTVKWQTSLGQNTMNGYSNIAQDKDFVYARGGAGIMRSINKNTGVVGWSQAGYYNPQIVNNKIYSLKGDYKIYGLHPETGLVYMQCTPNLGFQTVPFVENGSIYVTGTTPATPTSTNFVASYDAQTGTEKWKKNLDIYYMVPVVAGMKIYAISRANEIPNQIFKVMAFDINSGAKTDSIVFSSILSGKIEIINTAGVMVTNPYR